VSQQVKALEATLGIKLFVRERQRLVITEAAANILRGAATRSIGLRWVPAFGTAPDLRGSDRQHIT
jgi:hypothetical protein